MSEVILKILGKEDALAKLDTTRIERRVHAVMDAIVNDAASHFAEASPKGATRFLQGAWLNSTGVEMQEGRIVGYLDPTPVAPYAWWVIHGRPAGRMPPVSALQPWVEFKTGERGRIARAIAFRIARRIARRGTRPNDFVTPVEKARMPLYQKWLQGAFFK